MRHNTEQDLINMYDPRVRGSIFTPSTEESRGLGMIAYPLSRRLLTEHQHRSHVGQAYIAEGVVRSNH